ncbi:hypothetical protein [Kangiella shandongensis]|uniref:hypothetical protein n=1 Tax=Kangiella shandongensis TaxID=2763258 RepID=UPI001CC0DC15|nr:hypothetical protein [Kangiella shandongensis]
MKNLFWGMLIFIGLLGTVWLVWPEEIVREETKEKEPVEVAVTTSAKVIKEADEPRKKPQENAVPPKSEKRTKPDNELPCYQKYQKKPEWKEIEAVLSSIFMNGDEAAGQGVYQQLPIAAVKSYADTGDKDAMFHYGSELMWKAAFGMHLNSINRNPGETLSELSERAKKHNPDFDEFLQGADYAYRAAIKGKLGGIMEIAILEKRLIRRMVKSGSSTEDIEKALIHRHASLSLMQKMHTNDPGLLTFFSGADEFQDDLNTIYSEQELQPEIREELESKIKTHSQQLLQQWKSDRQALGLEPFPDVMSSRLDQFLADMEQECGQ